MITTRSSFKDPNMRSLYLPFFFFLFVYISCISDLICAHIPCLYTYMLYELIIASFQRICRYVVITCNMVLVLPSHK